MVIDLDKEGPLQPTGISSPSPSQDLMVVGTTALVADSNLETGKGEAVAEVINTFKQRRLRIKVFENARILFDPKMLPGVTPQEAIDFLIKGIKLDPSEEEFYRKALSPEKAQHIREYFTDFIDSLKQQNNDETVMAIWGAIDADPITKMALQWEIQGVPQVKDEYIEEHADGVAADLRKLDALIKTRKGSEVVVRYTNVHSNTQFSGLNLADGTGLGVVQNEDPNNPYRDLVLNGPSVYSERDWFNNVKTAQRLVIPFKARKALSTVAEAKALDDGSFVGRRFDPDNNFSGVIFGDEVVELREKGGNPFLYNNYPVFKKTLDQITSNTK